LFGAPPLKALNDYRYAKTLGLGPPGYANVVNEEDDFARYDFGWCAEDNSAAVIQSCEVKKEYFSFPAKVFTWKLQARQFYAFPQKRFRKKHRIASDSRLRIHSTDC